MHSNFGKYDIPPTLQRLIDLQNILADREQFYVGLNFYLSLENFRYFNTPSDVVETVNGRSLMFIKSRLTRWGHCWVNLCPDQEIRDLYVECLSEIDNLYNEYMSVVR